MNLSGARLCRKGPIAGLRLSAGDSMAGAALGGSIQREDAAHSIVLTAQQPEQISKGNLAPLHVDLGRLQASRSSRNVAAHQHRARGLQCHTAAPGLRFELQAPSPSGAFFYPAATSPKPQQPS